MQGFKGCLFGMRSMFFGAVLVFLAISALHTVFTFLTGIIVVAEAKVSVGSFPEVVSLLNPARWNQKKFPHTNLLPNFFTFSTEN